MFWKYCDAFSAHLHQWYIMGNGANALDFGDIQLDFNVIIDW